MKTTDFGYQQVPEHEKVRMVEQVFSSVASRYDLMNDLMSLGVHRIWKRIAISMTGVRKGQQVLDLAGGTGDLTAQFWQAVGNTGGVTLADINGAMLNTGRDRLLDRGITGNVQFVQANAECLPFPDNSFDIVTIAFGLRNVTHKEAALAAMQRVLKPGGCGLVLEFSKVVLEPLRKLYDLYSFNILPKLGQLVAGDKDSYQYLVESIRKHPDQETLKAMMTEAGFELTQYYNLSGGIVAIHRGYKL